MLFPDRLKRAFYALFKASVPLLDYFAMYRAKVVADSSNGLLDVVPVDPRVPSMGGIPLRQGLPGATVSVRSGSYVMVGWSSGNPAEPYCALWDGGETDAIRITIVANSIELGGSALDPIRDGLVHGSGISDYSGLPYWQLGNASSVVRGKK